MFLGSLLGLRFLLTIIGETQWLSVKVLFKKANRKTQVI